MISERNEATAQEAALKRGTTAGVGLSARSMPAVVKTTVLIVEDHADTRTYIQRLLSRDGLKVLAVPNRDEAAKIIESERVDIILLDYFMPGMSAFKFITLARGNNPEVRIVLMTAAGYAKSAGMMLGVSAVIEKPLSEREVLSAIVD